MIDPDFFRPGEALSASKLNAMVSAIRERGQRRPTHGSGASRIYRPFDPISIWYETAWMLILQPSFVISGSASQEIKYGDQPLSAYPEIEVEENKGLYLDLSSNVLSWESAANGKLLIIEQIRPDEEEEGVEAREFRNAHPSLVFNSLPNFYASIVKVGDDDKIAISPGYVIEQNVGAEGVIKLHTPTLGGTAIDAGPPPLAVSTYVYLRVQTDKKGVVTGAPTIEGSSSQEESTHHVPGEDGVEGDYYFLLCETQSGESGLTIKKRISGNVQMPNQLIECENIGGKRPVYKDFDQEGDMHRFRTLEQLAGGDGIPIIRPLGEGAEEGETIQFRNITHRQSGTPEIEIVESDNSVIVQGNGVEVNLSFHGGGSLSTRDGLVVSGSSSTPEVDGVHANVEVWLSSFDFEGKLDNPNYEKRGTMFFRHGSLVRVELGEEEHGEPIDDTGIDPEDIPTVKVNRNFIFGETDPD